MGEWVMLARRFPCRYGSRYATQETIDLITLPT